MRHVCLRNWTSTPSTYQQFGAMLARRLAAPGQRFRVRAIIVMASAGTALMCPPVLAMSATPADAMHAVRTSAVCQPFLTTHGQFAASFSDVRAAGIDCRQVRRIVREHRESAQGWKCAETVARGARRRFCRRGSAWFRYSIDSSGP
jgi:hypothetical protein